MAVHDDEVQNQVVVAVLGIVGLVVAGVIGLGVSHALRHNTLQATAAQHAPAFDGAAHLYFEPGQEQLPPDATELLAPVVDMARAVGAANLVIVPFFDATTNAEAHATQARQRAERVRHALEASGVAPDHLALGRPMAAPARDPAQPPGKDTRRVDVVVQ